MKNPVTAGKNPATSQTPYLESEMRKSLSQLEATQAVAATLQRQRLRLRIADLERQRYAALELAKELRQLKAHTYASENADLYRGFDNGCEYAVRRIEAIFSQKKCK